MLFSHNCSRTHIIQKVQHLIIMHLNLKLINGVLFLTSKKNLECLHKKEVDCCTTGYTYSYCDSNYHQNIDGFVMSFMNVVFSEIFGILPKSRATY